MNYAMSIIDVDRILERLSSKFHKFFYDREFVCCVQEDFKVILKNRNRCCVVIFPVLGPIYLKAVQYQAKIFDLDVFTLGSSKICSIAVCDKKFLIKKAKECEELIMPSNEHECEASSTLKKKRPERQLYIPPAQRRLPGNELPFQNDQGSITKPKNQFVTIRKRESRKKIKPCEEMSKLKFDLQILTVDHGAIENKTYKTTEFYSFMWWKYALFEPSYRIHNMLSNRFMVHFTDMLCNINIDGSKVFNLQRNSLTLYILCNDYVLWQPKIDIFIDKNTNFNLKAIPPSNIDGLNKEVNLCNRTALTEVFFSRKKYLEILENYDIYCDFDVYWLKRNEDACDFLDVCCKCYYYIFHEDTYGDPISIEELISNLQLMDCNEWKHTDEQIVCKTKKTQETISLRDKNTIQNELHNNNINNGNSNNFKYIKNTINVKNEKNELEEEKEIMRKTKENINRKTRPIIKYVDDANDTLKIDRDNVNNWEDLFDEEGQLEEGLLKEIVHKVGNDVTIIKAKEDYSNYFTKHMNIEELEHMVELYDFPLTLETHDLIHAFSEIKSDAMYVKWVDDTHAILVLGSSSQAKKAINVQNPLIKVRPMTAASKESLSAAYRNDLKPAMKRPPTNLQTARRLITTHLGTKSGISKEISAKERDDLKAAREMKKLVKKNEQDAWDGKLKSSKD